MPPTKAVVDTSTGWTAISTRVRDADEEQVRDCKEDIDTLLVFAGLFSAVMTAFTVESYHMLQPDSADTVVRLLERIASQTGSYRFSNGFLNSTAPPLPPLPPFQPPHSAIIVNALWFSSLIISLVTASFGMLVKQWLREYLAGDYVSAQARLRVRHFRRPGLETWKVFEIAALLPVLLQLALGLFFIGLCFFTWSVHPSVGRTTVPLVSGWVFLFSMSTIAPLFSARCPYKTTFLKRLTKIIRYRLSVAIQRLHRWLLRTVYNRWGRRRYVRRLLPMLSYQMTSFIHPSHPWALQQPYEEDFAAKDDSFDQDILLSVDAIVMDDELVASTMWDLLAKTRVSANERLAFVFSVMENRTQEKVRSTAVVPQLSNIPRRQCYIISHLIVDLLHSCLQQLYVAIGPQVSESWTTQMVDILVEVCSPSFYAVATKSSWATVKSWFCDADLRRSLGTILSMADFKEQRRRYLLNLRRTLTLLEVGEEDAFAVVVDSLQWCIRGGITGRVQAVSLPSHMLLSTLGALPGDQLDQIIPRVALNSVLDIILDRIDAILRQLPRTKVWQEPFTPLMEAIFWCLTVIGVNNTSPLDDVDLLHRIHHTCESSFANQTSRASFFAAFASCRSLSIVSPGGTLDGILQHVKSSRRLATADIWNGPLQEDIGNMIKAIAQPTTPKPDMEWMLRFMYLLMTFIPPDLRRQRQLWKWRPAIESLYSVLAQCPRSRTQAEEILACHCLYLIDRIDGPSGTRHASLSFRAWCNRIHRSNGTLFAAHRRFIEILVDVGHPERPWPWCVLLHWRYPTAPIVTPQPALSFPQPSLGVDPAVIRPSLSRTRPRPELEKINTSVPHNQHAVFSLSTPTASELSPIGRAPSFPVPSVPASMSDVSNATSEPGASPVTTQHTPVPLAAEIPPTAPNVPTLPSAPSVPTIHSPLTSPPVATSHAPPTSSYEKLSVQRTTSASSQAYRPTALFQRWLPEILRIPGAIVLPVSEQAPLLEPVRTTPQETLSPQETLQLQEPSVRERTPVEPSRLPSFVQRMVHDLTEYVAFHSDALRDVLIQNFATALAEGRKYADDEMGLYREHLRSQWTNDCRLPWQPHQATHYEEILDRYQNFLDQRRTEASSAANENMPREALRWIAIAQDLLNEERENSKWYWVSGIPSSVESEPPESRQPDALLSAELEVVVSPTRTSPISGPGSRPRTPMSPRTPVSTGSTRLEVSLSDSIRADMSGEHGAFALQMARWLLLNRMEVAMRRNSAEDTIGGEGSNHEGETAADLPVIHVEGSDTRSLSSPEI